MPPADPKLRLLVRHSDSSKDRALAEELLGHLRPLERFAGLDVWSETRIRAGDETRREIERAIDQADVALLLLSADFFASDTLLDVEVPKLLEKHRQGSLKVIPVLLRSCLWEAHPWLSELRPLPRDGKPVASHQGDERDRVLTELVKEFGGLATLSMAAREDVMSGQGTARATQGMNITDSVVGAVAVAGSGTNVTGTVNIGQVVAQNLHVGAAHQPPAPPLEAAIPKLRMLFSEGLADRLILPVRRLQMEGEVFVAAELDRIKETNPKYGTMRSATILEDGTLSEYSEHDLDDDLDKFLSEYEAYLGELSRHRELENRTIRFALAIINEGRTPAEEVGLTICFPADIDVWNQSDKSRMFKMPDAPQRDRDKALSVDKWSKSAREDEDRRRRLVAAISQRELPNVSPSLIQKTDDGTQVEIEVRRIKHDRKPVKLVDLYVRFPSLATARTFTVDYRLFAANAPDFENGRLTVVIDTAEP